MHEWFSGSVRFHSLRATSSPMALQSVLEDQYWISLVQPFLWADEELRISTLSATFLGVHAIARNEILSGISLWIRIRWEIRNDRHEAAQLNAIWRREWRVRTGSSSDSDYSVSECSEW